MMPRNFTYVDLFSGCGGFSLGLERAGFELVMAVEKSPMAAETFFHNFVERISDPRDWYEFADSRQSVRAQASSKLVVKELSVVLESKKLLSELRARELDIVVGGPPCQGFSSAGKRDPADVRNMLPWQFLTFVSAVRPKAVVIENVSGMQHDFKKYGRQGPFQQLRTALIDTTPGYVVQPVLLNAIHYGVPQHRPRVMLIAVRQDVARALDLRATADVWRSDCAGLEGLFPKRPDLAPKPSHLTDNALTVADAIGDLGINGYRKRTQISAYSLSMRTDMAWMTRQVRAASQGIQLMNHDLREHTAKVEDRFRLYQYFRKSDVPFRALGILSRKADGMREFVEQYQQLFRLPATAPDGTVLARSKRELAKLLVSLGTKKHSQRALAWDEPSNTVMSIPDDLVHPDEPRTMTVRELARFQSFPDTFVFRSKVTTGGHMRRTDVPQYTQVANAVPPRVAEAVGSMLKKIIQNADGVNLQLSKAS